MKQTIALVPVFIFLSALFCSGQTVHSFLNPMASLTDGKNGSFTSIEAGFSVDLPKDIHGGGGMRGVQYNWRLTEGYYFAGIEDREKEIENTDGFENETSKMVETIFRDIARNLFATGFEIKKTEKKIIEQNGHQGIETRLTLTDTIVLIRVFWVKNRAYQMAALLTKAQKQFEPRARAVFDSLKVLPREDTEALARRKIEESTPAPLPQSPSAPKIKSDAEDENLKGRVKYVLTEHQFIKGKNVGAPKKKSSEVFYDEAGNFIKRIGYDDTTGFPFQIRVYGYIDGQRAEKTASVVFDGAIQIMRPMSGAAVQKPRDPRYSSRFEYQYAADGKLKEKKVFLNDGSLSTRTTFTYKGDTVEIIVYQDKDAVRTRSVERIDRKGHVVESIYYGFSQNGWQEKSAYSYDEFDDKGNWTKRTQTFYRPVAGAAGEQWKRETRRTITYY